MLGDDNGDSGILASIVGDDSSINTGKRRSFHFNYNKNTDINL
ncbi:hypothetical protein PPIS_b1225 [Pseudoalteromonas piscicida]|uniref:Uncharacterized protein n=1 Tax=Pseudoalteromonas piscicida TaxID=43662 RepID=A0ABN5CKT7_PSEO7|nr:hypothetical protein PPIS_b1225 [Pseudoalteromonas piscicida]